MGLFSKLLKKDAPAKKHNRATLTVAGIDKLTDNGVRIKFSIPVEEAKAYKFKPGQYVNVHHDLNGVKNSRSYSICSGPNEPLSIGVKAIENGLVSNFLVKEVKVGDQLEVDYPIGNFKLPETCNHVVCFAAGSGITPILSMAKYLGTDKKMDLFYGNSFVKTSFFLDELAAIPQVNLTRIFSQETIEGARHGRLDKQLVSELIKENLTLLRADGFYICGPEAMILGIQEVLHIFGIPDSKIHFELFTTPVLMKQEEVETTGSFSGKSKVTAILDGDITTVELDTNGKTVLEALDGAGMDVPYSCKGGVCCTCKAKIIEGSAKMKINYALTDEEVKDGYILTCQSHPTSEVLKIDFDV